MVPTQLICRTALQVACLAAGVGAVWMMGSPHLEFDPATKQSILVLIGTLAAAAGARPAAGKREHE